MYVRPYSLYVANVFALEWFRGGTAFGFVIKDVDTKFWVNINGFKQVLFTQP